MPESQATTTAALTIGTRYPALGGTLGAILCTPAGTTYGLIVSNAEHELEPGEWGKYGQDLPGARGTDGAASTRAMAEAGSTIAKAVQALSIAGHSGWFIPSRFESLALYEHLREAFDPNRWYWTSTQCSRSYAWIQGFEYGYSCAGDKVGEYRVRPVRMIQLGDFTPSALVAAGDGAQLSTAVEPAPLAEAAA